MIHLSSFLEGRKDCITRGTVVLWFSGAEVKHLIYVSLGYDKKVLPNLSYSIGHGKDKSFIMSIFVMKCIVLALFDSISFSLK